MTNTNTNTNTPFIFQIGLHRCGTTSLARFFELNGIPSVHNDGGGLAMSMYFNMMRGSPIINDHYGQNKFFSDMEYIDSSGRFAPIFMYEYFKELDRHYPDSLFILNVRNKDNWINSKIKHMNGGHLRLLQKIYGLDRDSVILKWSEDWDNHINDVLNYFISRPDKLIVFDIENDSPEKLCHFFSPWYNLDPQYYGHYNKGKGGDAHQK